MNYQNKWREYSLNIDFWHEVLVNRKIVDLSFNENGLNYFALDNGEKVYPFDGTLLIKTEDSKFVSSEYREPFTFQDKIKT